MFVFGENKYFKSCHASTVAYLPGAGICAAASGGTAEGRDDVGIFVSMKVIRISPADKNKDKRRSALEDAVVFGREIHPLVQSGKDYSRLGDLCRRII